MVKLKTPIDTKAVLARHHAKKRLPTPSYADAVSELASVLSAAGHQPTGMPVIDGNIHRGPETGSYKKGDDACWYVARELDNRLIYASYGSWRTGEQGEWNSRGDVRQLSAADRSSIERARQEAEAKREVEREAAAQEAQRKLHKAEPAQQDHPYLVKKQIEPHGIKQSGDELLVPVSIGNKITSYQRINVDGEKRFLTGGRVQGGYFQIGEFGRRIIVSEGFATAASINQATGEGVAVAFNAGNLLPVVQRLRDRYKLPIVIAGDDDRFTKGNPGRTKAEAVAAQIVGVSCAFPEFLSDEGNPTDFNDLHCREGLDAVRKTLEHNADQTFDAFTIEENFDPANLPVRPWLMPGLLMRGYVTAGVAPPGVGKSTFAAMIAIMVATGTGEPDA